MQGKKVRINPDIAEDDFKCGCNEDMLRCQQYEIVGAILYEDCDGDYYVEFDDHECYLSPSEVILLDDEIENLIP